MSSIHSRTRSGVPSRVALADHPLYASASPESSYAQVSSPGAPEQPPAEADNPEGSDEGEINLTDQDEDLSDGSSLADASVFGAPDIAKLMELGLGMCRAPTQVGSSNGGKVPCVCGRTAAGCVRHATHRINGKFRYPVGYYLPMDTPARGFRGHGRVGTFYTHDKYHQLANEDFEEMARVADGMQEGMEDDEEEIDELDATPQVTFGPGPGVATTNEPYSPPAEELRTSLSGLTRQGRTAPPLPSPSPSPTLWYGLLDISGARWLFQDLPKAQAYVDMGKIFRFSRVFENRSDAYAWKEKEGPPENVISVPSDSSINQESSSEDSDASKPNRSRRQKDRKKKTKKPSRLSRKVKGKGRSRHRDPSPPSSSSSSDSSSSDSDTTDSSSGRSRRLRQGRKKKASRKAKRRSKGDKEKKFLGNDPSVGNRKRVHDLPVNGKEIDTAAGPPDMRSKDSAELWNAAVDVTALPGMFINVGSGGDYDDDAQRTTEMAATLIATVVGKRAQIHDSLWKTHKRHALGQVKGVDSLFRFVKSVAKSEESAFEQQENALQAFMLPRRYDEEVIDEFVQNGFLPRLTAASFRFYSNLLSTVRQLAYDHSAFWDKGPAKAMLDFHSGRLLTIRQNALTRKALILQTYTYLRDANSKSFYHESMTESLWDRLSDISSVTGGGGSNRNNGSDDKGTGDGGGDGGGNKTTKCSHCRSSKLHELMGVRPSRQLCPLKDMTPKKARDVTKHAIDEWNRNPSAGGFPSLLEKAKNSITE